MAREKYKTLTEQILYILICLKKERCGIEIMEWVSDVTKNRVTLGPGALYALIRDFVKEDMIKETSAEGRRRNYIITDKGLEMLNAEYERLRVLVTDYERNNIQ